MQVAALDLETYLIAPTVYAPPIVVGSYARRGEAGLMAGLDVWRKFKFLLDRGYHVVGQNFAFDLFCVAHEWPESVQELFAAMDAGVLHDTMLREILIDIRKGSYRTEEYEDEFGQIQRRRVGYSLGELAMRRCGIQLNKGPDAWRLRYAELHGVPLEAWPKDAIEYATDDAVATLAVYESQEAEAGEYLARVEPDQVRAAFALRTIGARGMCVDLESLDALEADLIARRDALMPALRDAGVYRASGTKNMARLRELVSQAFEARGEPVPTTKKGEVSTSAATLKESGDPLLAQMAELSKLDKTLTAFIPGVRIGAAFPLPCEYETIVDTGRTSSRGVRWGKLKGPQFQNFPRSL